MNFFIVLPFLIAQSFILFLIGFVIEGIAPADEHNTVQNILFNLLCTVFRMAGIASIGYFLAFGLYRIAAHFPSLVLLDLSHIGDHGNWFASVGIAFCWWTTRDFFYYWIHRAQHASKWLWAEHELHHSDEHMNVTTSTRHHWLEVFLDNLMMAPLIIFLRPPLITAITGTFLIAFFGYFIHLNSRITLGPLNRIFANPSTHRIHHSRLPEHIDKNFAQTLQLWDVLFGTYYHPEAVRPPTGVEGRIITSWLTAFTLPFETWAGMLRRHSVTTYEARESSGRHLDADSVYRA